MHVLEECHTTTNPDEILDSGSTIAVAKNKTEFNDLKPCEENAIMATNAGSEKINHEGKWKEWGQTYLVPNAITNIVSVSRIVKKGFRVVLDTDRKNTFFVIDKKNKAIRFPCDVRGLYAQSSDPPVDCCEYNLNTSVEGYTKREVERAIAARKFYHDLNAENLVNMKAMIRMNQIKNVPVSTEDFDLANKIFGKDAATCKGKWVRPKPMEAKDSDMVDLPKELRISGTELDLAIDVLFINAEAFLHCLDRRIKCPNLVILGTRAKGRSYNKQVLVEGLDICLQKYNRAGITIKTIHADNEFKPALEVLLEEWEVNVNFSLPGEHVGDIEREDRTLQERFRVNLHRLPYLIIPRVMIRYLALRVTKNRSLFPRKTGISKYYSPYVILKGRVIDFKKEFEFSFGDYVQANHIHQIKNNNLPRSFDAIYLRADDSYQGGHQVMNLSTGNMARRVKCEVMKMTSVVVDRVQAMAARQGYKTLKFYNRKLQAMELTPIDQLMEELIDGPDDTGLIVESGGQVPQPIDPNWVQESDGEETDDEDKELEPLTNEEVAEVIEEADNSPGPIANEDEGSNSEDEL